MTVTAFLRFLALFVVLTQCAIAFGAPDLPAPQPSPDAAFASDVQSAQQAYAAGEYHRAAALYDRIVRANPVNPTYWRSHTSDQQEEHSGIRHRYRVVIHRRRRHVSQRHHDRKARSE
jgi:hypothetical protein